MWIISCILSILLTMLTIYRWFNQNAKKQVSAMSACFFMILTLLFHDYQIYKWVLAEDWSALLDVIPLMFPILCIYCGIILIINIGAIFIHKK